MQVRQGDVLLTRVDDGVLDGAEVLDREDGRVTLALGEKSGHAHVIVADGAAEWRGPRGERYLHLAASDGAVLRHVNVNKADAPTREHDPIALESGVYEITIQRTYAGPTQLFAGVPD